MQSGMAPASYEQGLRRAMSVSQLQQGLIESAFITNQSLSQLIALQNQKRNVEMLVLSLNQALEQQTVSDQEIDDYYKENSSRFQSPEKLKVQYLALNLEQMAALIEVSESELEQAYQERITQYTTAETRAASHILITLSDNTDAKQVDAARERAAKIYADLQAGELTFADLEASAKEDDALEAGKLGTITPNMMEPSFTQALYDLAEINAVTEPVQTSFGFHIIRLDSITDEEVVPLAEVKDELMQDIRQRRVEPEFFAAAETLANLSFEHQDSLQTAAEALDIEIQESDWFERSGTTEGIAQYRQVVEAAYGLEVLQEGYNSPVLEVEPSHLIVIRKADYQPAQPLSLEDARDDIENTIKRQKAREQLNARADELLTQLKSGIAVEQLAEQNEGTAWQKYEALERSTPGIDNAARELAFRLSVTEADTPAVGSVSLANGDQALLAVLGIDSVADAADDASEQVLRATLERQIGLRQYQAFVGSQRGQAEVQTFPDRL
jgi:peptidyl-prolyl cis-trans isomerase D